MAWSSSNNQGVSVATRSGAAIETEACESEPAIKDCCTCTMENGPIHPTEEVGLRLRGEFFNIVNHPNFGNPTNTLTSPLFGSSTQTLANSLGSGGANGGFDPLYQIGGPRSIQLALKLQF
jgi:hypothetical protein